MRRLLPNTRVVALLVPAVLSGCASQTSVNDETTAIKIATKLCASQIKAPGIKIAHKTNNAWEVILAPAGAQLPHEDWWVVELPSSGPTSDTECFRRRGMMF